MHRPSFTGWWTDLRDPELSSSTTTAIPTTVILGLVPRTHGAKVSARRDGPRGDNGNLITTPRLSSSGLSRGSIVPNTSQRRDWPWADNRLTAAAEGVASVFPICAADGRFRVASVSGRHSRRRVHVTPSRRSAQAQHSCCEIAANHPDRRVRRNNLGFDRFQWRWQLVTGDLFCSHFRNGPEGCIALYSGIVPLATGHRV